MDGVRIAERSPETPVIEKRKNFQANLLYCTLQENNNYY